ncbi:Plasmid maintenance system antidote protein [uncultured Candidatus Thioglobus sp.]|nr:Plasmid maintenance system antidote protein [uncultured Candidatus Thioglobus sp.]
MSDAKYEFKPDWLHLVPPGEIILESMQNIGLSQKQLAQRIEYSTKHIHKLLKGEAPINSDTALRLEKALDMPAYLWLNLENAYREALAQKTETEALSAEADWLKELPLTDMKKWQWVKKFSNKGEQVKECLKFYGVSSVAAWHEEQKNYQVAFKAYENFSMNEVAIQTWLRVGEINAREINCQPFDKQKLKQSLPALRELTLLNDPDDFLPTLQEICAQSGVAIVFAPTPNKCPMSGATKWITSNKALLLLSLRHKTNDHLWFAFFHEIGHILKHKKQLFLEGAGKKSFKNDEKLEHEANEFSSEMLIPKQHNIELSTLIGLEAIKKFAKKINIAPGIVVGRLQHQGSLNWGSGNKLKVKYDWEKPQSK